MRCLVSKRDLKDCLDSPLGFVFPIRKQQKRAEHPDPRVYLRSRLPRPRTASSLPSPTPTPTPPGKCSRSLSLGVKLVSLHPSLTPSSLPDANADARPPNRASLAAVYIADAPACSSLAVPPWFFPSAAPEISEGYDNFSAKDIKEKMTIVIYIVFGILLVSYIIGNISSLNVKRSMVGKFMAEMYGLSKFMAEMYDLSKFMTEIYDLSKFMKANNIEKGTRKQIKKNFRLQFENTYIEAAAIRNIPDSCRNQILECLYKKCIEKVPLFKECTAGFIEEIVHKLHVEFFHPDEIILKQGRAIDRLYFVCHGKLEGIEHLGEGNMTLIKKFGPNDSFGEIEILRNMLMSYSVHVRELSKLISLDRKSFKKILKRYYVDSKTVANNLIKGDENHIKAHENPDHLNAVIQAGYYQPYIADPQQIWY